MAEGWREGGRSNLCYRNPTAVSLGSHCHPLTFEDFLPLFYFSASIAVRWLGW